MKECTPSYYVGILLRYHLQSISEFCCNYSKNKRLTQIFWQKIIFFIEKRREGQAMDTILL